MKKILSLILVFAMIFSLAMPAVAADDTTTGDATTGDATTGDTGTEGAPAENTKQGYVTAEYDPTIEITGVTLSESEDDPNVLTVDTDKQQYIVTIPAGQTQTAVTVNVEGQKLDMIPAHDTTYKVNIDGSATFLRGRTSWGSYVNSSNVGTHDIRYSNDGQNYIDTGWDLVVQMAPTPTDVSVKMQLAVVDTEGNIIENSSIYGLLSEPSGGAYGLDTQTVWSYDHVITGPWEVSYANGYIPEEYQTPADISLTITDDGNGNGIVTSNSDHATVKQNDEGVWIITVTLEKAEETAEITGLSIVIDGVEYDKNNTSETDPAVINPNSTVVVRVHGTNLNMSTSDQYVAYTEMMGDYLNSGYWTISGDGTVATVQEQIRFFESTTTAFEMKFSNEGTSYEKYVGSNVWIIYDDGTIEIDGLSLIVNGVEHTTGTVIIKEDDTVVLKVTGKNLNNNSGINIDNGISTEFLSDFTRNETNTEATLTLTVSNFPCRANELEYQNAAGEWIQTGLFIQREALTYGVTGYSDEYGNKVGEGVTEAKEGDTVTLTVEAVAGYAYVVDSLVVINVTTGAQVDVDEATKSFVMPNSSVTVTAEFEKLLVTSAEITWGSMAFTYSDEQVEQEDGSKADKGWSNDGTEGAGTITVKNTGETAITATATYAPEEGYEELGVSGFFAADSASEDQVLDVGHECTFTLTLSGQPKKALSGETIGQITITIEKAKTDFIPV